MKLSVAQANCHLCLDTQKGWWVLEGGPPRTMGVLVGGLSGRVGRKVS